MATDNPYMKLLTPERFHFSLPLQSTKNSFESSTDDKNKVNSIDYGLKDFKPQRSNIPLINKMDKDRERRQDSTCLNHYQQSQYNSYANTVYDLLWNGIEPD